MSILVLRHLVYVLVDDHARISRSRRNGSVHWYDKAKVNGRRRTRYAPIKLATLATEPTGGETDLLSRVNLQGYRSADQLPLLFFFPPESGIVYVLSDSSLLTTSQYGEMIE